jgi:hypothetical protein
MTTLWPQIRTRRPAVIASINSEPKLWSFGKRRSGPGWPWHTTVFVQWDGTATLLNGDDSYFNRGLHVITLRWGKVCALDVFEDSQEVARGLAAQAAAGVEEAAAEQIVS